MIMKRDEIGPLIPPLKNGDQNSRNHSAQSIMIERTTRGFKTSEPLTTEKIGKIILVEGLMTEGRNSMVMTRRNPHFIPEERITAECLGTEGPLLKSG